MENGIQESKRKEKEESLRSDVIFAKENCPFVVSNDTSSCFQNGLYGRSIVGDRLIIEGGKVKEKVDFDLKEITKEQEEKIQANINQVKKVICR